MTRKELLNLIKEIIEVQFSIEPEDKEILLSSNLIKDFKADELDMIEIIMELEDEFDIDIPDKDMERWKTISDIYKYLCKTIILREKIIELPVYNRFELLDIRE